MASSGSHIIGFWPVVSALVGNSLVAVIKLGIASVSGSSSMFSEGIHSVADTLNQGFLFIGLVRSRKKPDDDFGYGYGRERFFWALLSACGIFFVGAGVTLYHGIMSLFEPSPIEFSVYIYVVLLASFVIELWTLYVAARSIRRMFPDLSWRERLELSDPTTLAVYLEDCVAVVGVLIAAFSIALSYYTGNYVWDALGSLIIGCMLAGVAVLLIMKNRFYLMGRAMPEDLKEEIVALLVRDPVIEKVLVFKSTTLDFNVYRLSCEVEINGPSLLKEMYKRSTLRSQFDEIKNDFEEFKRFCVHYSDRMPRLIGKHIDIVEAKLMKKFPSVRHIDIEVN
ncbi:MAG TPA: cation diffusion facilitator family transporter [Candidatus Paceibacterota bacterium]